jgi:hypothetical protein
MKRVRLRLSSIRNDPEFMQFLRDQVSVDENGKLTVKDCYAYLGFNLSWKGKPVSVTYANAVWFLTRGRWPEPGHHIDHINDDPLDNRPENLQEITEAENQAKRRGRKVYRSYGTGKYGHGLHVYNDKRDNRFYVSRNVSRGVTGGKKMRIPLGGYDTLAKAEERIRKYISEELNSAR